MRGWWANVDVELCHGIPELWRTGCLFHLVCNCGNYLTTVLDTEWFLDSAGLTEGKRRAKKRGTIHSRNRKGKA